MAVAGGVRGRRRTLAKVRGGRGGAWRLTHLEASGSRPNRKDDQVTRLDRGSPDRWRGPGGTACGAGTSATHTGLRPVGDAWTRPLSGIRAEDARRTGGSADAEEPGPSSDARCRARVRKTTRAWFARPSTHGYPRAAGPLLPRCGLRPASAAGQVSSASTAPRRRVAATVPATSPIRRIPEWRRTALSTRT